MKVWNILFVFIFSAFSLQLSAQSSIQLADKAFGAAEYDDAAQLYDMAASLASGTEKTALYASAKKSRTCKSLLAKGADLYQKGDTEGALKAYQELLKLNPNDKTAAARKKSLSAIVAKNKAAAKAEKEKEVAYNKSVATFDESSVGTFVKKYALYRSNPSRKACNTCGTKRNHLRNGFKREKKSQIHGSLQNACVGKKQKIFPKGRLTASDTAGVPVYD